MELIAFLAVGLAVIYVLYKAYGPKADSAPTVTEVAATAEVVESAPAKKPAAKKPAAKKTVAKKTTTRKSKTK